MSHFSVLVVTDETPNPGVLERVLMPWHEFECTGLDNEYVVDVDKTEEALAAYDTDDSKGEQDVVEWVCGYYWLHATEAVDVAEGGHKHGYVLVDEAGGLVKVVDRTNPNKRWDWWTVGGRFQGLLSMRGEQARTDYVQVSGLDIDRMRSHQQKERREWLEEIQRNTGLVEAELEAGLRAQAETHEAWLKLDPRPRGSDWIAWLLALGDRGAGHLATIHDRGRQFTLPDVGPGQTLAEWVEAAPPLPVFAAVVDGKWHERGKTGWWGSVSDEKDKGAWAGELDGLLGSLRPEQWLTVVDCHI